MAKGPLLQKAWDRLPEERKQKIQAEANERIESCQNLKELRHRIGLTQDIVSETLDLSPSSTTKLEKSSDMLLSTLQEYVTALGGKLTITVEIPDQPTITLSGLSELADQ